jgi:hypothetical protein
MSFIIRSSRLDSKNIDCLTFKYRLHLKHTAPLDWHHSDSPDLIRRRVSDKFYGRIIVAGVMEHCISHCMEIFYDLWLSLKAVEIKRFVSYFSNFTRECLGSVYCVRCGFKRVSLCVTVC